MFSLTLEFKEVSIAFGFSLNIHVLVDAPKLNTSSIGNCIGWFASKRIEPKNVPCAEKKDEKLVPTFGTEKHFRIREVCLGGAFLTGFYFLLTENTLAVRYTYTTLMHCLGFAIHMWKFEKTCQNRKKRLKKILIVFCWRKLHNLYFFKEISSPK